MAAILIIDDSAQARAGLHKALSAGGHDVSHAVNGIAGLQRLMTSRVDLMVVARSAMRMPGPDFLRRVRQYSPDAGILIVLTGGAGGQDDVDAVFGSRFSNDILAAAVNRLLRRGPAAPRRHSLLRRSPSV